MVRGGCWSEVGEEGEEEEVVEVEEAEVVVAVEEVEAAMFECWSCSPICCLRRNVRMRRSAWREWSWRRRSGVSMRKEILFFASLNLRM